MMEWGQMRDWLYHLEVALSGGHLPMQERWVQSLGQEDPLEEGMATHSNTLAWRIPWTEEPGGLQSMGSHRVHKTVLYISVSFAVSYTGLLLPSFYSFIHNFSGSLIQQILIIIKAN